MAGINNCLCTYESFRYSASYSSNVSTTLISEEENSASSKLSVSTQSTFSYSESYSLHKPVPAVVYESPAKSSVATVKESNIAENSGTAGSSVILAFIEQAIQAGLETGASIEELQDKLDSGYQGFTQGYNEAKSLLENSGLFEAEVKNSVEQMFNEVLAGFEALANTYGLRAPTSESPTPEPVKADSIETGQIPRLNPQIQETFKDFLEDHKPQNDAELLQTLIEPSRKFYAEIKEENVSSNSYSFRLRTKDGDSVYIQSFAAQSTQYQAQESTHHSYQQFEVNGLEDFQFQVKGSLDSEEMAAINDLLSQLNDVAELFFEGEVYSAFEQALDVGFNSDEIARFSLNLQQTNYSRLEESYGAVAKQDPKQHHGDIAQADNRPSFSQINRAEKLGEFFHLLDALLEKSEKYQLQAAQLANLGSYLKHPHYRQHPHFEALPGLIEGRRRPH